MEIAFVGDVMLGRLVADELRRHPPEHPWGDALRLLRRADVLVGNLEFVLSSDGRPWPGKTFHFRADPAAVASLEAAGFDLVSVANNHVLDFGWDAAAESLATLASHGIRFAGAGEDLEAAQRPAVLERAGLRVGMLAFTDNEPGWAAGPGAPGVHHVPPDPRDPRAAALFESVARARDHADLLVVSAHWGGNWGVDVPPTHRAFARALVDAGADVVFGHSPHIPRGVEVIRGRPVLYSAGDFVDDYAVDPVERNDRSFVFVLRADGGVPVELRLHPTEIGDCRVRLAGASAERIASEMSRRCAVLGTRATWDGARRCLVVGLEPGTH
ncbi:CapA family protein [Agromyces aurantiacus]|uniref:CapA family protein n=1 Tax=Agromyces aurantiacus TaxID=165814 RepID=A0ABV9RDH7_9MICO|nr:CapA family protein [Agromyces aurantiacus]MBM7504874.1 poly-gamma-glutamate synthesis protein (capsule biosynthesis protein) [Agromyces aurantiacus]